MIIYYKEEKNITFEFDYISDATTSIIESLRWKAEGSKVSMAAFTELDVQVAHIAQTLVDYYYELPGNEAGGILHVLLDDNNYDCVGSSLADAKRLNDMPAILICELLSNFTEIQIELILEYKYLFNDVVEKIHSNIKYTSPEEVTIPKPALRPSDFPQIVNHPSNMSRNEWKSYDRPCMVAYGDKTYFARRKGPSFYTTDLYKTTANYIDFICKTEDAIAVRGLSGFDF